MTAEVIAPQAGRPDLARYQRELFARLARAKDEAVTLAAIDVTAVGKVHRIDAKLIDFVDNLPFITPLPERERYVLGTCILRGRVYKVLDFAALNGGQSQLGVRIFALKERHVAFVANLSTGRDRESLPIVQFRAEALEAGAVTAS